VALVIQTVVESRRYSGWIDPRYPIGYWQAVLAITGNATGGALGIDLVFQGGATNTLNSQMYSVERFSAETTDAVSRIMEVSAVNMGGPSNAGFNHSYGILVDPITGQTQSRVRGDQLSMLPWFLGSQRTRGITASISLVTANVDTIVYRFEAEGYRWSARSVLVDGGPQRPPTGLYAR